MDFLPELEPVENLETNEEKETETNVEMEIKQLNEPPTEEPIVEEESPFQEKQVQKPKQKPKKRRGEPKAKPKPKPKRVEEVKNMMIYEEKDEEEEEPPEREEKIEIDPKRAKRLENLKKAREARKAKADYKKKTPKLKPALEPEPSIRETFNTHLLPTEEEKQKMIMEREHYQFMTFMNNMEKYKNFKKGFQMAQMADEFKEKKKQEKPKPKPKPQEQAKQEKQVRPTPSIIKNEEPFNEYSSYFS